MQQPTIRRRARARTAVLASLMIAALVTVAAAVQRPPGTADLENKSREGERRPLRLPATPAAGSASSGALDRSNPDRPYAVSEQRQPCRSYHPLRWPYFGDLHVHTAFSQDASTQGTRNTPRDAYRFARGEELGIQPYDASGHALRALRLARPLDFAAVTDHAEQLGEVRICNTPGLPGYDSLVCRFYRWWPRAAFFLMNARTSRAAHPQRFGFCGEQGAHCLDAALTQWQEIQAATEAAYDRSEACEFTSFVGYEWTASPGSNNLHRNVIFRNEHVTRLPVSYFEANTPEELWRQLRRDCFEADPACELLTIPHNSNLSGGLMFQTVKSDGSPFDADYARERAAMEPLAEIMQHKGDSECLFGAGNEDELCGFEKLPYDNFQAKFVPFLGDPPQGSSFVRNALESGLLEADRLGVNPFKYGLIASTDTHLGTPGAVDERKYPGHGGAGIPAAERIPPGLPDNLEFNPGGLAVLWAEENSRDALFAAMKRREAYGTSGPRIVVRFFGGWDYPADLCDAADFVPTGYARGVPMGADLPPAPSARPKQAPRFAVWAKQDAGTADAPGTPLERIQIVKGWIEDGQVRERVYDVAGDPTSDTSVNPRTCETSGKGFAELCRVWTDPSFDTRNRAFYYARVVENPTCRWSARICNAHGVYCADPSTVTEGLEPCCAPEHQWTVQERAWTSPIWYLPPALPGR